MYFSQQPSKPERTRDGLWKMLRVLRFLVVMAWASEQTPASRELSKNSCLMRSVTVARCLAWNKCPNYICLGVIDNNKFKNAFKVLSRVSI